MVQPRRELASVVAALTCLMGLFFAHAALSQQGLWKPRTSMPTPRRLLAAAADGENIYTFGGCGSPCFEPPLHTSTFEETRVEVYNTQHDTWQMKNPMSPIL